MSNHVWLVAMRDLTESFRSRAYWVTMALLVAAVGAAIVLPQVLDSDTTYDLGLAGEAPAGIEDDLAGLAGVLEVGLDTTQVADRDAAEAGVRDEELHAALVFDGDGGASLVRLEDTDADLVALATQATIAASTRSGLVDAGLEPAEAERVLSVPPPAEVVLDEDGSGRGAVTYFVSLVLYLALFMGGMGVATGVAVEKSSRIAEVLVTTVRPSQLLAGKVLGVGISTLLLILAGAIPYSAAVLLGVVDLPTAVAGEVLGAIGWFVLGYAIYATGFAALGALVDRQEDLGGAIGPFSSALVLSFIASVQAQTAPDSTLAQFTSYFPLSSPMVMPVRIAEGAVGPVEVALAIVLGIATFLLLVRVGGTIYRRALLRGGRRLKVREVLQG